MRLFFILLTIGYIYLIWIQSSHFNPESLAGLTMIFSRPVNLLIGASLEFTHLFQFGLVYLCIIIVFLSFGNMKIWQEVIAIVIAIAYGVIDEIHQLYVPFRSFSLMDLLKNVIGILFFVGVIHRSYFYKKDSKIGNWLRSITKG